MSPDDVGRVGGFYLSTDSTDSTRSGNSYSLVQIDIVYLDQIFLQSQQIISNIAISFVIIVTGLMENQLTRLDCYDKVASLNIKNIHFQTSLKEENIRKPTYLNKYDGFKALYIVYNISK